MDCSLPGSSIHGVLQAKILEWVACLSLLQGIFPTQESNRVSCIAGGFFTNLATREALYTLTPQNKIKSSLQEKTETLGQLLVACLLKQV